MASASSGSNLLRHGTVVPSTLGRSAGIGCQMALEGHTGANSDFKNGCGDHLHFQRQTSSSINGTSTSITFSDVASNPMTCTTNQSLNAGSSCTF